MVSRKSGLPENYSTKNMSDDYAEMVNQEFDGKVDLVIGISYGGMIAQHFAADHLDLFGHLVIAMAAHRISEGGKNLDTEFAELLSQGKMRSAYLLTINALYPKGIKRGFLKALLWIVGLFMRKPKRDTYSKDIIIEAKAEVEHEAVESLKKIQIPVLIIAGDKDFYFPYEYVKEMADIIEENKLIFYIGKGHNIIGDERFAQDIKDFISKHS
jgi:pimeloyl-ACP methyl ester carboxylesterase